MNSKLGLYSFLSGVVTTIASLFVLNYFAPATDTAPSNWLPKSLVGIFAILCIWFICVPGFKKIAYPNILGLVGIILNLVFIAVLLTALSSLLSPPSLL